MLEKYFNFFDVESKIGLVRLIIWALALMFALRAVINPEPVTFPTDTASVSDYWMMIAMSSLLIALDAMLLVMLNFRRLRTWQDALVLAGMVGGTHVIFPLSTFAITAAVYYPVKAGWLPVEFHLISAAVVSGIYYLAFHFVAHHLREVLGGLYDSDVEEAPDGLRSWQAIKDAWPAVFAVSIDALIVGPAKIAFMDRYETLAFLTSFVWIGLGVFTLVLASGVMVILLRRFLQKRGGMASFVRKYDFFSYQLLVIVFMHFNIFAGAYLLYTFVEMPTLLETLTIWGGTGIVTVIFLLTVDHKKLREAVEARSEAVQPE